MGVRFACHQCGKHLNIKRDLAGKRGVCPACQIRFRIPNEDAERSIPIDTVSENESSRNSGSSIGIGTAPSAADHLTPIPRDAQTTAKSPGNDIPNVDLPANALPGKTSVASGAPMSLAMIDADDAATWYVRPPTGGQYGPADTEMLRQWIDQGRVASSSLLWRDGWPQWRSAAEALPEFSEALAAAEAPPQSDVKNSVAKSPQSASGNTAALSGDAKLGTKRSHIQAKRYGLIGGLAAMTIGLCAVLAYLLFRS